MIANRSGNSWPCQFMAALLMSPVVAVSTPTAWAQSSQPTSITVPPGPLAEAIVSLAKETGLQIVASSSIVVDRRSTGISGRFTPEQALTALLDGSGLQAEQSTNNTYVIRRIAQTTVTRSTTASEPIQQSPAAPVEEIVVTGTRIERTTANSASPIDVVRAAEIDRLGLADNTEALRYVPALQQSIGISSEPNFFANATPNFGLATLDLRGLGTSRTLVLVNGRRHVSGVAGAATVDVSSIPSTLIDRVEVLTGGGSSIYGADAVSGVVNYILKDDFEGIAFRTNYNIATQGDGDSMFGSLTLGGNFDDDRGNAVISIEYHRQTDLRSFQRDGFAPGTRPLVRASNPELAAALGIDPNFTNAVLPDGRFPFNPLFPGSGVTFLGGLFPALAAGPGETNGVPNYQRYDRQTGTLRPFDFGVRADNFASLGGDGGVIPLNPAASLIPDTERYLINGLANYDITPFINAYAEIKYSRNDAEALDANAVITRDIPIARDNPFLPAALAAQYDSLIAAGETPTLTMTQVLADAAVAVPSVNERETFRAVSGVRGELSESFTYDVSINYGRTSSSTTDAVAPLLDRFYAGIDAVRDPASGQIVCRSDLDPTAIAPTGSLPRPINDGPTTFRAGDGSCVPINIFSQIFPEAAAFFMTTFRDTFDIDQFVVNSTITGSSEPFFELPAGPVGYAAGFEYRDEQSNFQPDALELAGFGPFANFGQIPEVVSGSFDVSEFYAEFNVPILADKPFAQRLDLNASVRFADYSTVGDATSYAFGGFWQPIDDLRLPASFNRAVRTPNIAELFSPQFLEVDSSVNDPCSPDRLDVGSEFRRANCAQLVPANFDGTFLNAPPILETNGGNPDLLEETADTFTVGIVYQPSFVPGLTLMADYYDIEIEGAILLDVEEDAILNNCVDAPSIDNAACAAITRNPTTGFIETVQLTALNLSSIRTRGIGYQFTYDFDLSGWLGNGNGSFRVALQGNYLLERENQAFTGLATSIDDLRGESGEFLVPSFPEHFVNASLSWTSGPFAVDYGFNYQSSQTYRVGFLGIGVEGVANDPFLVNESETGDAFVHFLGGSYQYNDALAVSLRVNNLTDEEPFPLVTNGARLRPTSALGRTVQLGIHARF